jgi:hypothetical protein
MAPPSPGKRKTFAPGEPPKAIKEFMTNPTGLSGILPRLIEINSAGKAVRLWSAFSTSSIRGCRNPPDPPVFRAPLLRHNNYKEMSDARE